MHYRKHFTPIESNPQLLTELSHNLGVSNALAFHDVFSLTDLELLTLVPRPVLTLVLVFPSPGESDYESYLAEKDRHMPTYDECGNNETVVWYRQTINNACGLEDFRQQCTKDISKTNIYGDLDTVLSRLVTKCKPLKPPARAAVLENDLELEEIYKVVALCGGSAVPTNPEDEVDCHYVCFVKSRKDGHLYELDGDRKGPVDWGAFAGDDLLSAQGLSAIEEFIKPVADKIGLSLLALVKEPFD